jgi:hypothetical protein
VNLLQGELAFATGRFEAAAACLSTALSLAGQARSEGIHARSWINLGRYAQGDVKRALTDIHEMLARLRRSRASASAYLRCLEAVSYLAKGDQPSGTLALRKAAEFGGLWGMTAQVVLQPAEFPEPEKALFMQDPGRAAEACFIAGEGAYLMGQEDRGIQLLEACCYPDRERAMFTRLARTRLALIA